jgi:circadian clock protein KaiB
VSEKFYEIKLFIAGNTPNSKKAVDDLNSILKEKLGDDFVLMILNVFENPEEAEEEGVFATPTVKKVSPPPGKRVIGDFSDKKKVLDGLNLE